MRVLFGLLVACSEPPRIYPLAELPVTAWTAGLPVHGDGRLVVDLTTTRDWSSAEGTVDFLCDGCTLGDGRAKLELGAIGAIEFQPLTFDTVRARAVFRDGLVRVTSQWRSRDLVLDADVDGVLARQAGAIELAGCVAFQPTAALLARAPRMHALVSTTGAPTDERGRFTIRLGGTLGAMERRGEICAP